MKKVLVIFAALFAVLVVSQASFAAAPSAAGEKVGFIDDMEVLRQFPKFQSAQKQIQAMAKKKSDAAKIAFDKETDKTKKNQIVQNMQLDMRQEEAKVMAPILKEVNAAVAKVAKAKGVTLVLNKALVYFGGVDITNDVVTSLKR